MNLAFRLLAAFAAVAAVFNPVTPMTGGQEKITLAAPVFVDTGATEFRVSSLYLNRQGHEIRAQFTEVNPGTAVFKPNGRVLTCAYTESAADAYISALNTMNFSTTSLEKKVTQVCQNDGKLGAGTISGTPQ